MSSTEKSAGLNLHDDVATEKQTCFACPEVWRGVFKDGRRFYFRYRYGKAVLVTFVDDQETDATHASYQHEDDLVGIFNSHEERREVFKHLWDVTKMGMKE